MFVDQPELGEPGTQGAGIPVEPTSQPTDSAADSATHAGATEQPLHEPAQPTTEPAAGAPDTTAPSPEPATAAAETPQTTAPAAPEPSARKIKRGDVLVGTIVETSPTEIQVDIGEDSPGIITSRELDRTPRRSLEALKVGDKIEVYVVNPHDHEGKIILSANRAAEELDWQKAEEYRQNQQVYEARIAGYNKGGLIVRFGRLRGFVPTSQMAPERRPPSDKEPQEYYDGMVNQPIMVKVMEVDRARNRLILSERTATRESREKRKETLISQLKVGEVRTGTVVSLEDFGAFVDIGGAEGLVHLTEISWKHINHPRELLKKGQTVTVEVISIDPEHKRIGLSMRRQEADPWDTVATTFNRGQLVRGEITKMTKFGAFARLVELPEIEGLIHISELSNERVAHPKEVVNEGDVVTLRVVNVDIPGRRLGLSLKQVTSKEYLDFDFPNDL